MACTLLVYGEVQDGLVFVEKGQALWLARAHEALSKVETWGEFQRLSPEGLYEDALERFYEWNDESYPDPEDKFDPGMIPGYSEGDWLSWPAQSMLSWVPQEIQDRFGSAGMTAVSGDYLDLPPEREDVIVAAMREYGYVCERNDDLVWKASGY